MAIKPLVNYINDELKKGKSKETIRIELMNGGWQLESVSEAFYEVDKNDKSLNTPAKEIESSVAPSPSEKTSESDKSSSISPNAAPKPPEQQVAEERKENISPLQQQKKDSDKPLKPPFPRLGLTLGEAWDIYKRRFWTLIALMFFTYTINSTFLVFMSNIMLGDIRQVFFDKDYFGLILFLIIYFLIPFIVLVGETWGTTSLLFAITHHNESAGIVKSLSKGWGKILSYWWLSILIFFIVFGGSIFIIPGLILPVSFSLASFILMNEKISPFDALLKSREYVRNYWWSVFSRLFLLGGVYFIITTIVSAVSIVSWNIFKEMEIINVPISDATMTQIGIDLFSIFTFPLLLAYTYSIYDGLRAIKSGFTFESSILKKVPYGFLGIIGLLGLIVLILFLLYTYAIDEGIPAVNYIVNNSKYLIDIAREGIQSYFY